MDIKDFEGVFKYKLIIPLIFIINWSLIIIGPFYIPYQYQIYSFALTCYAFLRMCYLLFNTFISTIKSIKVLNKYDNNKNKIYSEINRNLMSSTNKKQIFQAFIIPNYKQDIQLIEDSLVWIGKHQQAKQRFLVFLAMQKAEQNSQLKAEILINKYKQKFKIIQFTQHQLRQNQQRGKASNVNWCAQKMEQFFMKYNIDQQTVMVNIVDADSWVAPEYIQQLQNHLYKNIESKDKLIYLPPQIFTRNHFDVPVFVRVHDMSDSLAHFSNLCSITNINMPKSNYTMSYNLIKKIGFWDTCQDAIGQDLHTTLKAYYKTRGQIRSISIFIAFNQVNIQTGKGYISDIFARFQQAQRHARGVADIAYIINIGLKIKYFSLRALLIFLFVFDPFFLIASLPWIGISNLIQKYILQRKNINNGSSIINNPYINYVLLSFILITFISWVCYEIVRRKTNRIIFKKQNESLVRSLEIPLIVLFVLSIIIVPAAILASFGVLFKSREYITAQKRLKKTNEIRK